VLRKHNGCSIAWIAIVFIMISASTAWSQEKSNYFPGFIHFYQEYISPVDGDRCTMYPSCSRYLEKSVKKHGVLTGWIMGLDRLVRCGRDEVKNSLPVWIQGRRYTYDPVENNDFWWSDK
jgi:uncharacterized protein